MNKKELLKIALDDLEKAIKQLKTILGRDSDFIVLNDYDIIQHIENYLESGEPSFEDIKTLLNILEQGSESTYYLGEKYCGCYDQICDVYPINNFDDFKRLLDENFFDESEY